MTSTHKAWRLHAHNDLRFEDVETPKPAPDGVLVRIEAGMVLSYMGRVLSGQVPYALPPMPFVPGTNAIGRIIATGENVGHVQAARALVGNLSRFLFHPLMKIRGARIKALNFGRVGQEILEKARGMGDLREWETVGLHRQRS